MGASEVSALLWRERELLELLLFKLSVQRLVLENGQMRWVGLASREIEQVLGLLRETSLSRDVEMTALAHAWGNPQAVKLSDLAAVAPTEPWREILLDHRAALTALMSELSQEKTSAEMYLRQASLAVQDTLASVTSGTGEYTSHGGQVQSDTARIVDREM